MKAHLQVAESFTCVVQAKQNETKYTGVSSNDFGGGAGGFSSKSSSSGFGEPKASRQQCASQGDALALTCSQEDCGVG